ncbi:hypothetical protein CEN47_20880, partial [Fischerella thermalis CCMEE 5319]
AAPIPLADRAWHSGLRWLALAPPPRPCATQARPLRLISAFALAHQTRPSSVQMLENQKT